MFQRCELYALEQHSYQDHNGELVQCGAIPTGVQQRTRDMQDKL